MPSNTSGITKKMGLYLFNSNTILISPYKNVSNFRIALSQKMKIVTYRFLLLAFVYSKFNVQELYIDINIPAMFFCLSVLYWSKWKSLIRQRTSSRGNYSTGFNILCVFGEFQRKPDLRYTLRPDLNLFDCSVLLFLPFFFFLRRWTNTRSPCQSLDSSFSNLPFSLLFCIGIHLSTIRLRSLSSVSFSTTSALLFFQLPSFYTIFPKHHCTGNYSTFHWLLFRLLYFHPHTRGLWNDLNAKFQLSFVIFRPLWHSYWFEK